MLRYKNQIARPRQWKNQDFKKTGQICIVSLWSGRTSNKIMHCSSTQNGTVRQKIYCSQKFNRGFSRGLLIWFRHQDPKLETLNYDSKTNNVTVHPNTRFNHNTIFGVQDVNRPNHLFGAMNRLLLQTITRFQQRSCLLLTCTSYLITVPSIRRFNITVYIFQLKIENDLKSGAISPAKTSSRSERREE